MKKIIIFSALLLIPGMFAITSCKKVADAITFDFKGASGTFKVPQTHSKGYMAIDSNVVKTDIDSIKKANGADGLNIQSLKVKDAKMTITSPAGQNFDAFNYINLYIGGSSLTTQRIAYINPVPKGKTSIDLTVSSIDLTQFFKQKEVMLKADGATNDTIRQPMTIRADVHYSVKLQ